jgi:hypothetical protein
LIICKLRNIQLVYHPFLWRSWPISANHTWYLSNIRETRNSWKACLISMCYSLKNCWQPDRTGVTQL